MSCARAAGMPGRPPDYSLVKLNGVKIPRYMRPSFRSMRDGLDEIGRLQENGDKIDKTVMVPAFAAQRCMQYRFTNEGDNEKLKIVDSGGTSMRKTVEEFLLLFGNESVEGLVCVVHGEAEEGYIKVIITEEENDGEWDTTTFINIALNAENKSWTRIVRDGDAQVPETPSDFIATNEEEEDDSAPSTLEFLCECGVVTKSKQGLSRHRNSKNCVSWTSKRASAADAPKTRSHTDTDEQQQRTEDAEDAEAAPAAARQLADPPPLLLEMSPTVACPSEASSAASIMSLNSILQSYESRLVSNIEERKETYAACIFNNSFDGKQHTSANMIGALLEDSKRKASEKFDAVATKVARLKGLLQEVESTMGELEQAEKEL